MKLYTGNLSFDIEESDLRKAFEAYGEVISATIVTDRDTGRPRGFGFVEMADDAAARAAIAGLHETPLQGRNLVVNEARARTERPHSRR